MEKRKGEDGLKIWKRKVIGHGVLGILLSFVIVGNATGIYGADIDDTVPVEAESEMTDSGKEEQQEITQEKTQVSDDPDPVFRRILPEHLSRLDLSDLPRMVPIHFLHVPWLHNDYIQFHLPHT